MERSVKDLFTERLTVMLGSNCSIRWESDDRGVICGWCRLDNAGDITKAAEIIAGLKGRVMALTPLITRDGGNNPALEINYHFYFSGVNCTITVTIPEERQEIQSITPVLKSADWHEREMQELFNVRVIGHPNPKKLFLNGKMQLPDHTMIPLSEAMNGASTRTLWEKVMRSHSGEAKVDE